MKDFSNSVMVALLPTTSEWCKIDLPHLTLVYVGEIPDLKDSAHNELAKTAVSLALISGPITLNVLGADVFGDVDKVDVLKLEPSAALLALRSVVEDWDDSTYPFNPHVTIGPVGSLVGITVPTTITFDRIAVDWGDSLLQYKFLLNH